MAGMTLLLCPYSLLASGCCWVWLVWFLATLSRTARPQDFCSVIFLPCTGTGKINSVVTHKGSCSSLMWWVCLRCPSESYHFPDSPEPKFPCACQEGLIPSLRSIGNGINWHQSMEAWLRSCLWLQSPVCKVVVVPKPACSSRCSSVWCCVLDESVLILWCAMPGWGGAQWLTPCHFFSHSKIIYVGEEEGSLGGLLPCRIHVDSFLYQLSQVLLGDDPLYLPSP